MADAYKPTLAVGMATSSVAHGFAGGVPAAQPGMGQVHNVGVKFDQSRDVMHSHEVNVHQTPTHEYGTAGQMATGNVAMPHVVHEPRLSKGTSF